MQDGRRLLRGSELGFQLCLSGRIRVQLVLHDGGRHAFHHHLAQLLTPGLNAFDLTLGSREAGAVLHPQPVHLARDSSQNSSNRSWRRSFLLKHLEHSRLDLVTPDGEAVVAGAFFARTEACDPIPAGHDEPSAADAALRQADCDAQRENERDERDARVGR
jgi:hypothetical protein